MRIAIIYFGLCSLLICFSCNRSSDVKEKPLSVIINDTLPVINCDSILNELSEKKADTIGKVKSIPGDIESCFLQLDSLFSPAMKEWITCLPDWEFGQEVHMSFGMYLRNEWGLWKGSPLFLFFAEKGINHPDDISCIILDSYQRKLKGKDIKLEEQSQYYKEFMRISSMSPDSIQDFLKKGKKYFTN